jgi:NitT/TauT family transport system ATP-binding protein
MSGGMQQCRDSLVRRDQPSVPATDEPFAAVDAQTREILQFELLRIWERADGHAVCDPFGRGGYC